MENGPSLSILHSQFSLFFNVPVEVNRSPRRPVTNLTDNLFRVAAVNLADTDAFFFPDYLNKHLTHRLFGSFTSARSSDAGYAT